MPYKNLQKVLQYPDIYEHVASGAKSLKDLYGCFGEDGTSGGPMKRRKEFLYKEPPYIIIDGDTIKYESNHLYEDLSQVAKKLCCCRENDNDGEVDNLKKRIGELEGLIKDQDSIIASLRKELSELNEQYLRATLEAKVLVTGSIEVGPKKHPDDDIFLDEPQPLLDVKALVSEYGGLLDSFYEENPTDEELDIAGEKKKDEEGRELTLDNYRKRMIKRIGMDNLLQKRLKDIEKVKDIEGKHGKLFPECIDKMYDPEDESTTRKKERNRILKNRFETLNHIIQSDRYTNQEKLMLFALNGEFHNTEMERYLRLAANYCIDANLLIGILQNPNVAGTYHNMVNFLELFKNPSEFRMKLEFARELIAGAWYITADYNGRKTRFQLVPIEEFNELRQKVGLPVSRFTYKEDDTKDRKAECEKISGDEKKVNPQKVYHAEPEHFDLPDDGLDANIED